jgi:hypothetical protein
MSASSKEPISASWTGIRDGSHIDKSPLTFRNDGIGVQVRKGSQDAKADDPQCSISTVLGLGGRGVFFFFFFFDSINVRLGVQNPM